MFLCHQPTSSLTRDVITVGTFEYSFSLVAFIQTNKTNKKYKRIYFSTSSVWFFLISLSFLSSSLLLCLKRVIKIVVNTMRIANCFKVSCLFAVLLDHFVVKIALMHTYLFNRKYPLKSVNENRRNFKEIKKFTSDAIKQLVKNICVLYVFPSFPFWLV